jgi:hypothetical protein
MNPIAQEAIAALKLGRSVDLLDLRDLPDEARKDLADWFDALPESKRWQSSSPTLGFIDCLDQPLYATNGRRLQVDVPYHSWYVACRKTPSGKHVFGAAPAAEKPSLDLVFLRDAAEVRRFEDALAAAGWAIAGADVRLSCVPGNFPALAILHEKTKTYDWWKLGTTPADWSGRLRDDRCLLLGIESLGTHGADAAAEKFGEPPRADRIDAGWLAKNGACDEGRKWFADTFGPLASVERKTVETALEAAGRPDWLDWLARID